MSIPNTPTHPQVIINVSALQALFYCPRQYYLQEVEGIHTPNAEVYSGLRLHTELERIEACNRPEVWQTPQDLHAIY